MSEASVTNVAAIAEFRIALANFAMLVRQAVIDLELESQRALNWITQDRAAYWRSEARRSSDMLARARDDLVNARTFKRVDNYVPSCAEEKKQVDLCKRRLEHAEQKIEAVRRWSIAAPRAVDEFRGPLQALMATLDGDIPRAMAVLERMSVALERYTSVETPTAIPWDEVAGETSMAQPIEDGAQAGSGVDAATSPANEIASTGVDSRPLPATSAEDAAP